MTVRRSVSLGRRVVWLALGLVIALMLVPTVASAVTVGTVNGIVVDAETGDPVVGAQVSLWSFEGEEYYDAETDEDGAFIVQDVVPGVYEIDSYADGFEEYYDEINVLAGENNVTVEMIAVDPNVSGKVTDPDGAPIAEASVDAYYYDVDDGEWWYTDFAETNESGAWGMDMESGVYRFGFSAFGFRDEYYSNAATIEAGRNVTVWPFKTVSGINAQLAEPTPSISGKVVDESNGSPIAEADLTLWAPDPESDDPEFPYTYVADAITDETGAYSFGDLEPGSYIVSAGAGGFRPELFDNAQEIADATPVVFSADPVVDIDFELAVSEVSLSGVVTSEETGLPLMDAVVDVFKFVGGEWVSTEFYGFSGEDGVYEVTDLPAGTYRLGFTGEYPLWGDLTVEYYGPAFWNGASTVAAATDIVVDGNQPVTGYDLVLPEAVASVTGTVTADGAPVETYIDAFKFDEEEQAWYTTDMAGTDADGSYEFFGLGSGAVRIGTEGSMVESGTVYGPAFWNGKTSVDEADDVIVTPGSTVTEINLALTEAKPMIKGTVVDPAGDSVDGAFVLALQESLDEDEGGWTIVGFGFAESGSYEILPIGDMPVDYDRPVRVVVETDFGFLPEFYNNKRTIETADDIDVTPGVAVTLPQIKLDAYTPVAVRVASTTRYSTAVAMAQRFTDDWDGVEHVIIASGEDRAAADPLAASGLSWAYNGAPVLLTPAGSTPKPVIDAVKAIVAKNGVLSIHVVGGEKSVPKARVNDILRALGEEQELVEVDRIAGANRFDNARLIAKRMQEVRPDMPDFALVANGADPTKFFDALALSAVSANTGAPILLVSADSVPSATSAALHSLPITKGNVFVAGGTNTVSRKVVTQLGTTEANRLAGRTRFSTAIAVSQWAIENAWLTDEVVGVAAKLPDALSGGALVGARGGSLLVTDGARLSGETSDYLMELAPSLMMNTPAEVYVFGGEASVSRSVVRSIDALLALDEEF